VSLVSPAHARRNASDSTSGGAGGGSGPAVPWACHHG
jgi:hypothetical protein